MSGGRSGRVALVVLALAMGVLAPPASLAAVSATPSTVPATVAALTARAQAQGSVRVIVGLPAPPPSASPAARAQHIASERDDLLAELAGTSYTVTHVYDTIPFVAMAASAAAMTALKAAGRAGTVLEDVPSRPTLLDSGPLINADDAWAAGFDGTGQVIAVLDTGVDASHPFLAGKVIEQACYSAARSCPNGQTSQTGPGAAAPCDYETRVCSHGTHVSGIAAGRGDLGSGIGRGANLFAIQVFSRAEGTVCGGGEGPCAISYASDQIAGLERVLARRRDGLNVAAVNMSLGSPGFSDESVCDQVNLPVKQVVDQLRAAGVVTIAAAGNVSPVGILTAPACISSVVSVGSTTKTDQVSSFSNTADFLDLLAPGSEIVSSVPGGGYEFESGTSQATPHVAGAWAVLRQQAPTATPDQILAALRTTGVGIVDPRTGQSTPRIDVNAARLRLAADVGSGHGGQPTAPLAAFRAVPNVGAAPLSVTFTNDSLNATAYAWDFGDGTGSVEASPVHVYADPGTYTVQLTATGPGGSDVRKLDGLVTTTEAFSSFSDDADGDGVPDALEVLVGADPQDRADNVGSVSGACPRSAVPPVAFTDVGGNVHGPGIACVVWYRLAQGLSATRFGTQSTLTRAELSTLLARLLDDVEAPSEATPTVTVNFPDVGGIHAANIRRIAGLGIIEGFPDGTFRPAADVTRAQVAAMLVRVAQYLGIRLPAGLDTFSDVNGPFTAAIATLANVDVLRGFGDGTFGPGRPIVRGESASVLARFLAILVTDADLRPPGTS